MIACPACRAENPDGFKFCGQCAAALVAPPVHVDERKVVTTLFCDLVAFTAMSEAADPEDVDALLGEYFARATKAIESHGGTVEKFIGDAVVGVFGVPAVHEDDPERAVRAGLRLLEALKGMLRPDGTSLQARVGVSTGEALVRLDVDPASGRGFLTGDAVNVAARLEAAAPPGEVVVGELAHSFIETAFVTEPLQPLILKGKSEPALAWQVIKPVAYTGLRTAGESATPFVGREGELAALERALETAIDGDRGQFALLVGDPGIGKSRLLLEFARTLDERPVMITWRQGRCLPYGDGVTFSALGALVGAHAGILDSDDEGAIEVKLDRVLPQDPDGAWLRQRLRSLLGLSAPRAERGENFAAWARFLALIADAGPAVVVLEDLHWADDAMLAFVDYVVAEQLKAPLLLVATARPELLQRPLGAQIAAAPGVRRRTLSPLAPDMTNALIAELLGDDLATDDAARIVNLVGGNPLYAEQYSRLLLEDGCVSRTSNGLRLAPDTSLPLSPTVQAVIAARLDGLRPEDKALLCDAAVIGVTFWRGAVTALSDRDLAAVDAVIEVLLERDFVRQAIKPTIAGETEYQFWHALVHDVAYGQLPRRARAQKHEAAAKWLESVAGESADLAEILVHHYWTSLELARATSDDDHAAALLLPTLRCLGLAGERALRLDPTAGLDYFSRALQLAPADSRERLDLLPRLAEAHFLSNHPREATELFEEALAGLKAAGETRSAAVVMCKLAHTLPRLGMSDRGLTREAKDLLASDDPSPEKAEVLAMHALTVLIENADNAEVLGAAAQAIVMCEQLGLPEPALALHCRAEARLMLGDAEGMQDYDRAVAAARAQGLGRERATIEFNRTSAVLVLHGPRAASRAALEGMRFARRHGLLEAYDFRTSLIAYSLLSGDWDDALGQAAEVLALLEANEGTAEKLNLRSMIAHTLALRGCAGEVSNDVDSLVESARESVGAYKGAPLLAAALVRLSLGETAAARDLIRELLAVPFALLANSETIPTACRAALACGREELARPLLQCCLSGFPPPRLPLFDHVVTIIEALLAEADGRSTEAAAGFETAAARWRGFGVPYEEAHALLGQGRCLVALGRAPEAAAPLASARKIFAGLGAKPALGETDDLLRRVSSH